MNRSLFITVNDEGKLQLSIKFEDDTSEEDVIITSIEQLTELVGNDVLMCSSSLDFPEEYTEDQSVIDLCDIIRGGPCTDPELIEKLHKLLG